MPANGLNPPIEPVLFYIPIGKRPSKRTPERPGAASAMTAMDATSAASIDVACRSGAGWPNRSRVRHPPFPPRVHALTRAPQPGQEREASPHDRTSLRAKLRTRPRAAGVAVPV